MRVSRILTQRHEKAILALAELCEERKDEELVSAPPYHSKPPTLPPQTPYTVGSQTLRSRMEERFSPPVQFFEPSSRVQQPVAIRSLPEHMAPKRGKWTSPPPPEAPPADHTLFENQLGMVLQLATSSTEAREKDTASESNSEGFTDEGSDLADDDIKSVKSYTEGSSSAHPSPLRRPSWHIHESMPPRNTSRNVPSDSSSPSTSTRGRFSRPSETVESSPTVAYRSPSDFGLPSFQPQLKGHVRRSSSGPRSLKHLSLPPNTHGTPSPPSPASTTVSSPIVDPRFSFAAIDPANVFYQASPAGTSPLRTLRLAQNSVIYPHPSSSSPSSPGSGLGTQKSLPSCFMAQCQHPHPSRSPSQSQSPSQAHTALQMHSSHNTDLQSFSRSPLSERNNSHIATIKAPVPRDIFPYNMPPSLSSTNPHSPVESLRRLSLGGPDTPTPATYHTFNRQYQQQEGQFGPSHSQTRSFYANSDSNTNIAPQDSLLATSSPDVQVSNSCASASSLQKSNSPQISQEHVQLEKRMSLRVNGSVRSSDRNSNYNSPTLSARNSPARLNSILAIDLQSDHTSESGSTTTLNTNPSPTLGDGLSTDPTQKLSPLSLQTSGPPSASRNSPTRSLLVGESSTSLLRSSSLSPPPTALPVAIGRRTIMEEEREKRCYENEGREEVKTIGPKASAIKTEGGGVSNGNAATPDIVKNVKG